MICILRLLDDLHHRESTRLVLLLQFHVFEVAAFIPPAAYHPLLLLGNALRVDCYVKVELVLKVRH